MHSLEQAWLGVKREFDTAIRQSAEAARRENTAYLNRAFRRLNAYKTEEDWIAILADTAGRFAAQVVILSVEGRNVRVRHSSDPAIDAHQFFPCAPALVAAIDSKDPVVALRTAQEVGSELSGSSGQMRIVPIANAERVAALLVTPETDETDADGLELLAGLAAAVLNRRNNFSLLGQITTADAPALAANRQLPDWADLSEAEQTLHLRAQRFARVAVAETQLARPEACSAGREAGDLYLFVKPEIDRARETYRKQFMTTPSMVDYLHLELLRVLADSDGSKLGVDYPGSMV